MHLTRLPNGELRLTLTDWENAELIFDRYPDTDLLTVTAWFDPDNAGAAVDLSRHQVRELLPHLEAFAETGSLEVRDGD